MSFIIRTLQVCLFWDLMTNSSYYSHIRFICVCPTGPIVKACHETEQLIPWFIYLTNMCSHFSKYFPLLAPLWGNIIILPILWTGTLRPEKICNLYKVLEQKSNKVRIQNLAPVSVFRFSILKDFPYICHCILQQHRNFYIMSIEEKQNVIKLQVLGNQGPES